MAAQADLVPDTRRCALIHSGAATGLVACSGGEWGFGACEFLGGVGADQVGAAETPLTILGLSLRPTP